MRPIVDEIAAAFADRAYPGDDAITLFQGSDYEGDRMAEFFRGRSWRDLRPAELRRHGSTSGFFTVPAYCYYLPAYLLGMLEDRDTMDVCWDHLEFDFGPRPGDASRQTRLAEILASLTEPQLRAVLRFFQHLPDELSVENLERAIAARHGSRGSPG
jgi:hypothetical protein